MRELLFQYGLEQIAYWRTQQQHEIDFIIKHERRAIEVKFQSSGIKPTKYKVFERMYPEYSLEFVVFDDILTKIMM
jgi:predicted AAA+ superfamily ATPase